MKPVNLMNFRRLAGLVCLTACFMLACLSDSALAQSVTGFTLVNADSDTDMQAIRDGSTLNLATLPAHLSLKANVSGRIGSVRFDYDGVTNFHNESIVPYAINGDRRGDFPPFGFALGQHRLVGTAFSGTHLQGSRLGSTSITFSIVDSRRTALSAATAAPSGSAVVNPAQISGVLANPDMGLQSGDLVATSARSSQGLPEKVAYIKWYWKDIETADNGYNWALIDNFLARARTAGQKVAFRIVVSDNMNSGPQWLRKEGVPGFVYSTPHDGGKTGLWVPNFDNATARAKHLEFLSALGARYNGSPDISSVDIGSVGLWGEWHFWSTSPAVPMPSLTTQKLIIDRYVSAFSRTPLVAQIEGRDAFKYAVARGTGYRGDCLGYVDNQMLYTYTPNVAYAGAGDAWKHAPVNFEACWDVAGWISRGYSVRQIFDWALNLHISGFNNKNRAIPSSAMGEMERFLQRAGYRFVLRQLSHPKFVTAGARFSLLMNWENIGVAPCYGNYNLGVQLRNSSGAAVWTYRSPTSVKDWLPGAFQVEQGITIPTSVARGTYTLAIGLVDTAGNPKIQLASNGRDAKGWYPYTTVTVQ